LYVLTANLTLTLPATPSVGDRVALSNMSGTTTPTVARNGNLIAGLAEDLTIDVLNLSVEFIYSGASQGWIIFVDSILGTSGGGGSVDGNGTTNYISKWSDANTLTDSLIFDNGTNVGIGTSSPAAILDVRGTNAGSQTLAGIYANNGTAASSSVALALTTGSDGTLGRIRGQIVADSDGDNAGYLAFTTRSAGSQTERMRINASGSIKISDGTLTGGGGFEITSEAFFGASFQSGAYKFNNANNTSEYIRLDSDGLKFNGDTAAANALDDYEEGTWTMGVSFNGASVGITYGNNTGTYTKVGRKVTVNGYIALINKGSSTGVAAITGLPFSPASGAGYFSVASLFLAQTSFADYPVGLITGSSTIGLREISNSGVQSDITNSNFNNNSEILISLTYFTA
jgi:hypothetical protein